MKLKWSVGDKVMAKWPGSALYFHAEIKAIDEENESVDVLFSDGTEMDVSIKAIRSEAYFSQPKRSKSPARSRRRSRSPGRSPGRRKQVLKKDEAKDISPLKFKAKVLLSSISSSSEEKKATIKSAEKTITTVTKINTTSSFTKSKADITQTPIQDSRYMMTRQRIKKTLTAPITHEELTKHQVVECIEYEYGGVLGVFLMYLTMPLLPLVTILTCNNSDCSITKFNLSMIPTNLEAYYSRDAFIILFGYLLFHAVIYCLPLGHIIKGPLTPKGNRLEYRISAMYTFVFNAIGYGCLVYFKVPVAFLHDEHLRLAFAAVIISYVGNFLVYIASFRSSVDELNPSGSTSSLIYDSFIGRELHPRIGKLFDLKLYLYRPAMAGWLVIIWVEMSREYNMNGQHNIQFLLIAVSQILYIFMEFFWDEDQCPFMFDIKNEGLGFVQFFGELVIVPFVYSLPVKYAVSFPRVLSIYQMVVVIGLLVLGFMFIMLSGREKSKFRKNPYDPKLSYLESIPSSRPDGDRILVSGYWGIVRHPNYLGEIFVGLAWSYACGFTHLLPWIYPAFVTVLLCHRSLRDDLRCRKKHGLSWETYCQRVKYHVIPGVF